MTEIPPTSGSHFADALAGSPKQGIEGAIAVFDLLGYKNFLESNEIEAQISILDDVIKVAVNQACRQAEAILSPAGPVEAPESIKPFLEAFFRKFRIEHMFISDTIVLHTEITRDPREKNLEWLGFLVSVEGVFTNLLLRGFPSRAAISYGRYYAEESHFLGKPLVEAYNDIQVQNWIGCILSKSAEKKLIDEHDFGMFGIKGLGDQVIDFTFPEYPVPTKQGERKCRSLNWPRGLDETDFPRGIRELLFQLCSTFRKTIDASVREKIEATEAFYWFSRTNHPPAAKIPDATKAK
jgi:hypothetical protein